MINIQSITFQNLFSFGNIPTTIRFNEARKTIITGINGHGKSTLITAICFALYGKTFRDIKKGGLVNNFNGSGLYADIFFNIKSNQYRVIRGIAPNIFEIYVNDVLLSQEASVKEYQRVLENEILNMNYKTFTQIVILGSSNYIPFMKLPVAHRREIIEDILNISIFSRMNEILKQRLKNNEAELQIQENNKLLTKKQYKFLFDKFTQSSKSKEERIKLREEQKLEIQEKFFDLNDDTKKLQDSLYMIKPYESVIQNRKKLEGFKHKIESNLSRAKKEVTFYETNEVCPKCNKELDSNHKEKHLSILNESISKYNQALDEITERITSLNNQINQEREREAKNQKTKEEILSLEYKIKSLKERLKVIDSEIKEILSESNEIISEKELGVLKEEVKSIDKLIISLYNKQKLMKEGLFILKDSGAKTRIINFYLPLINKTINQYLEKFNFNILFNFDENFEESCKARNYESFKYGNFSEGERLRIDLSLMFTWREIAKRKNSASVNLLFFDEILDSAMDSYGIEDFLNIISEYEKDVSFFVISHREGVDSFFDRHLVAIKENGFSRYEDHDK